NRRADASRPSGRRGGPAAVRKRAVAVHARRPRTRRSPGCRGFGPHGLLTRSNETPGASVCSGDLGGAEGGGNAADFTSPRMPGGGGGAGGGGGGGGGGSSALRRSCPSPQPSPRKRGEGVGWDEARDQKPAPSS